jgi:hypothetical protein
MSEPTKKYKRWLDRVKFARDTQENKINDNIDLSYKYYQGKHWGHNIEDDLLYNDEIVDNMVYTAVATIKPSIILGRPKVFVKPKRSQISTRQGPIDATSAALRMEGLTSFLLDELEIQGELEKCVVDALLAPQGYVMVGFEGRAIENDLVSMIRNEEIFVRRISPKDVIRDPEATDHDLKDDKFICIKWVKTLEEIKDDPNLKNTSDLKPNSLVEPNKKDMLGSFTIKRFEDDADSAFTSEENDLARVEGYDVWDREKQTFKVVVLTHDKFLRDDNEWPTKFDRFPVEPIWFNFNPDETHALADTDVYLSKQNLLNRIMSKVLDHVKRAADQKYAYNKRTVDRKAAEDFAKGPSASVIGVKGDPANGIAIIKDAAVSGDLYRTAAALKSDIFRELGIGQYESGGAEKLQTAKEAQMIQQGISSRRADRSKMVERFYSRVIKKVMHVIQQHVQDDSEIPLDDSTFDSLQRMSPQSLVSGAPQMGQGGQEIYESFPFIRLDRDLIRGDFNFKIVAGSTTADSDQIRLQKAQMLMDFAIQNPLIDRVEATKVVMELGGFEEYIGRLMRDPAEVQQEAQQAAQQQMQSEIAVDQPKRDTDLKKTQMKSITSLEQERMRQQGESSRTREKNKVELIDQILNAAQERSQKNA